LENENAGFIKWVVIKQVITLIKFYKIHTAAEIFFDGNL